MVNFLGRLFGKKQKPVSDQEEFAHRVIAALKEEAPDIVVNYDAASFELNHVDSQSQGQRTFLHNSFVEYQRLDGDERTQHIVNVAHFIAEIRRPAPKGEDALDRLLPVLRARADLIAISSDQGDFSYNKSSRPFCDNMLLMLAIDTDVSIGLVPDHMLEELGVTFDQALGLATAHLDEKGNHTFGQLAEGTFVSTCGDHYDASRVLIPRLFDNLPVRGNPVVIVQARSAILVTGSEDTDGLRMIADFALQDFPENERAVSLTPIELIDGRWRLFEIGAHHPQSLQQLRLRQAAWAYDATKQVLQKKLGDDIFVATAQLYENEGRLASLATWAHGVPTACPLVDAIMIQDAEGGEDMLRSMENVLDVCGPLSQVQEMEYPIRWLLPGHIPEETRQRLKYKCADYKLFE